MLEIYKRNIRQVYEQYATKHDRKYGKDWYRDAREDCERLAQEKGLPLDITVAVVSVISPRLNWDENVEEARKIIDLEPSRALGSNVQKADYILRDKEIARYLRGPKVTRFFVNICDPDEPYEVTVDTWSVRVCTGEWDKTKSPGKEYDTFAQAFREVAEEYGLLPSELQAICWVTIKRIVEGRAYKGQKSLDL